jgi:hypothetical protein
VQGNNANSEFIQKTFYLEDAMRKFLVLSFGLFSAMSIDATAPVFAKAKINFRSAMMVSDMDKLGGKVMDGATIQKTFSGKTLKGKGWSWTIKSDGAQSSKASDNSWTDAGTWHVQGDQFCRQSTTAKGSELCSSVYSVGHDIRFTDPRNPGKLHDWYLTF